MKNDRYIKVEVVCEVCSEKFMARRTRVRDGLARFCSKECFDIEQRNRAKKLWGRKDLAKSYKIGERYCARWYDENGKTKSTPYPRWWWEMNVGEIPDGMIILHKDNNPLNIDPSNFELGTKSDALKKGNETRKKDKKSWGVYIEKLRKKQLGFKHTPESKAKMSAAHLGRLYVSGENHYMWRGGVSKEYPKEFYKIREFVLGRDNYKCQICSKNLLKNPHVHHRDGDRNNNNQENLLTLCASCHGKVHTKGKESLPIMALRSELHWNK